MFEWSRFLPPSPSVCVCLRLYSGTLVHGLLRYLKGGRPAESLLVGGYLSGQLYSCLLDAVKNCSSKSHHSSSAAGGGRRRRGGGRGRRGRGGRGRGARGGGRVTEDINNRFAFLMSEEESDDDYWWGGGEYKWANQYKALARGQMKEDIPVFY